jgi:hypothetical membrane protein
VQYTVVTRRKEPGDGNSPLNLEGVALQALCRVRTLNLHPIVWVRNAVPKGPDLDEREETRRENGTSNWVNSFTDRLPWLGPLIYLLSILYFLTQVMVGWVWNPPYSLVHNTISDLGNTACDKGGYPHVCSPRWLWMDIAFVALGLVMVFGSLFIYQEFTFPKRIRPDPERQAAFAGFTLMAIAGLGSILVGARPENTNGTLHAIGAGAAIGLGNLGILILALVLTSLPEGLRTFMRVFSVLSLTAAICFAFGHYFGLGKGSMERIAAYPMTLWLIVFGMYISRSHRAAAAAPLSAGAEASRANGDGRPT